MPNLSLTEIEHLCLDALQRAGASDLQAKAAAEEITDAEAEGIRQVGLGYMHLYLKHLKCGKVIGDAVPKVTKQTNAAVAIDADYGFCHSAYLVGEDVLIAAAKEQGIGYMAIYHSYSAGVLGWFVRRLAKAGLVGLMFANSPKAVAAIGGKQPFFGTNPLAFGAPVAGDDEPLVFDMATAATARVNIVKAAAENKKIAYGLAIDEHGNPTTDASAALKGAQLPFGGAKGFGLGLAVDILAGALTGSNFSHQASLFANDEGGAPNVGQSIIAISPQFAGGDFGARLKQMLGELTYDNEVRIPGQRRAANRAKAEKDGVAVPQELLDTIENLI